MEYFGDSGLGRNHHKTRLRARQSTSVVDVCVWAAAL
jgi:hypothetical protein